MMIRIHRVLYSGVVSEVQCIPEIKCEGLPSPGLLDGETILIYATDKKEVLECDTRRFLRNFCPDIDPSIARKLRGKVMFTVDGSVPAKIYTDLETYRFLSEIHRLNPVWLFYSELTSPTLFLIWVSLAINDLDGIADGNYSQADRYTKHLTHFLGKSMHAFYSLCTRCGISVAEQDERVTRVVQYLATSLKDWSQALGDKCH